jgi:hypothetical protein
MFLFTAPLLWIAAVNFILTASPPASSEALTMLLPLDKRFKLFRSIPLLRFKLIDAMVAVLLVLIVIAILFP